MAKLLILFGILPVIASVIARKFFCDRLVKRDGGVILGVSGGDFARAILKKGGAEEVKVEEKRRPFLPVGPERMMLHPDLVESREAKNVAAAGLLAGLVLVARQQKKVFGWRKWAVKFGWAGPAFTAVVVIFGALAGRFSGGMAIGILCAMVGLAAVALWLTLPVERTAAGMVAHYLEETNIVARRDDAERLERLVKALGWRRLVPGCVEWMVPRG